MNYYNEMDPYAAQWLRNLLEAGHIPQGDIDERSIEIVQPEDLTGYVQCHFFAGIAGWSHALRLAGWPNDQPIWTGSCPCQPFSAAGKRKGVADKRHLWPHFYRLIKAGHPAVIMGEQVAGKAGYGWFDGVATDLEREGYACRVVDIPACGVNAPHIRSRLYWVANSQLQRLEEWEGKQRDPCEEHSPTERGGNDGERLEYTTLNRRREGRAEYEVRSRRDTTTGTSGHGGVEDTAGSIGRQSQPSGNDSARQETRRQEGNSGLARGGTGSGFWNDWELIGPDPQGKYRRVKPGVRLLAHGVPARVGKLRAYGNAIVPELAAEVIRAYMEVTNA